MQYRLAILFLLPVVLAASIPRPLGGSGLNLGKLPDNLTKGVERRQAKDDSLAEIIAYVDNDLNDISVDVLRKERREDQDNVLIKVIADVQDDLDDLTVKVLSA